jgi:Domain of unknown function (DUF222)
MTEDRPPGESQRDGSTPDKGVPRARRPEPPGQWQPPPEPGPGSPLDALDDDTDQEASLAATVAEIEAAHARGLITPDELDEDDGFLPPDDDDDDWNGGGPSDGGPSDGGPSDDGPIEQPAVAADGTGGGQLDADPAPGNPLRREHGPVSPGAHEPGAQESVPAPEFLDAGYLPRGRATAGFLPAQTSPPGPATPTGSPPGPAIPTGSPPAQATPPTQTAPPGPVPCRDRPGAGFAAGDVLDVSLPGPALAGAAETAAGPGRAYAGVSDDELIGVLTAWQRTESWAAAGRLSAAAELARRRPATSKDHATRGGIPAPWGKFCADEVAAALSVSRWAAEKMTAVAHDLATRLPLTRQALHDGVIDAYKAQIIAEATRCLDGAAAAHAEAAVVPHAVTGKTPGQIRALIARAVLNADPSAARLRREQAQKDARVELWREDAGTAAIVSFGLPPDEALAADQQITSHALDLKAAGVPGSMDALRVRAYLDALLGQDTAIRYQTTPNQHGSDTPGSNDTGPAQDRPAQDGRARDQPAPRQSGGNEQAAAPAAPIRPAARINLTIPLATLLGLADHSGEAIGFGPVDAALARDLAAGAAVHSGTTWCVTVTDLDGQPVAHGCGKPGTRKPKRRRTRPPTPGSRPGGSQPSDATAHIRDGASDGQRSGPPPGTTTPSRSGNPARGPSPGRSSSPGSSSAPGSSASLGGYGTWRLRPPGAGLREPDGTGWPDLTVDIEPIPVDECDHRHQTSAHDPSDRLRHLVDIRDGNCSWPPCRRDARRCDYEHTVPWEHGGATCACNGGPRCRHHHHAKQARGWQLQQNRPGYHTWTTPAGRTYTSGPVTYPV